MDALILAAGLGSRLGPLTKSKQKCLLPVRGKPLLDYWIRYCIKLNINKIFINSHHCSNDIEAFINRHVYKNRVTLLHEAELLGTGGTLVSNLSNFNNDLLFVHGDNFITFDVLKNFYLAYQTNTLNISFWMMLHETNQPETCGVVKLQNNKVIEFHEKVMDPPSNIANSAIYILSQKFLNILSKQYFDYPLSFSDDLIPKFLGNIYGYYQKENVIDIGTPENYKKVR